MKVRRVGSGHTVVLVILAGLVLVLATVLAYGRREVFDTRAFTARAVEVVRTDAVSSQIARTLTRQAIESGSPDLVAVRPIIETSIERLLRSGAADPPIRRAVSTAHGTIFSGADAGPVALNLRDVMVLTQGILRATNADAPAIPTGQVVAEVEVVSSEATTLVRVAERVRRLGLLLPIVALLLFGAAVWTARDRRRSVVMMGCAVAAAGFGVAFLTAVGRTLVVGQFDGDSGVAAAAVWNGFLGGLGRWALALIGIGCIIGAAAASVIPRPDVRAGLRRFWQVVTARPDGRMGQLAIAARGVAVIGFGVVALFDWAVAGRLLIMGLGAVAVFWGISELLRLVAPDQGRRRRSAEQGRRTRVAVAATVGGIAGAAAVGLAAVALATGGRDAPAAPPAQPCNGSELLCDRPLNEVAMVASHNSMSVAVDPGWFNAHHYNPILDQLDAGVRALLIDTHLGQQTDQPGFGGAKRVQTDLSDETREQLEAEVGAEALAAAERLTGRIEYGQDVERPRLYLCHGLCEIGATDALTEFRRIAGWLRDHPDQVVVIIVQDDAPMSDNLAALRASGLSERAWEGALERSTAMPTLRDLIGSKRNVVLMHESRGDSGVDWFHEAYAVSQETPFAFPTRAAIESTESCAPNRGRADAPFFLLNHWLDKQPVLASQAKEVNASDVLGDRVRRCGQLRGAFPNFIAVNFVELGDPYSVVDELNGLAAQ